MMKEVKKRIQDFIDKTKPAVIDKTIVLSILVSSIVILYLFATTFKVFFSVEITQHSKVLYSALIINSVLVFFISLLGDRLSKAVYRPKIYLYTTVSIALTTYCILAESLNSFFVGAIETLIDMTTVPLFVVQTNSKILTILVPVIIVSIGFYKSMTIAFKKEYKSDLQEYTVDILTRNVEKIDVYNIDCKICEDFETGEDIYLTEKQSFRHMLIAGNSGSGKTSLVLRPYISQLFYKKAKFREELKQLTLEALKEGLCEIKVPVTNKYFNENFSMDFIKINENKKDEFIEKFKHLIIGVRESEKQLFNKVVENGITQITLSSQKDVIKTVLTITSYITGIEEHHHTVEYISSEYINKVIDTNEYTINITVVEGDEEAVGKNINIELIGKTDKQSLYTYKIVATQFTQGKIIYRNTGVTTVAPDGGLGEQTVKIGAENGIKVHRIDPKLEEINKGVIATYNPMMLGDPEKTGDIIAAILLGMEDGDVNPYFKNAGIRAIRNLVILLRITYPIVKPNVNPTLVNLLELLNDFGKVSELCEEMKKDSLLADRWKPVIEYLESNFYEMKVDGQGNRVKGTNFGVNRKKCQEAITGTINQLDNFIGREEIRYILCNEKEGINLNDVLENGECIAIATRQAELGDVIGRAFALFFIMSLQTAVLSRYSEDEAPEIPYEILIDEFPFYLNDQSKVFFTFSRKYKCSVTCVIQNIAQLREQSDTFKEIILTNTNTKLILPGANVEDRMYYTELLGFEDVFEMRTGISSTPMVSDNARYMETKSGAITEKNRVSKEELASLKFKNCYYSVTDVKGRLKVGKGNLDFLKLTSENTIKNKILDFNKYLKEIRSNEKDLDSSIIETDTIKEVKITKVELTKEVETVDYDQLAQSIDELSLSNEQMSNSKEVETTIVEEEFNKDISNDLKGIEKSSVTNEYNSISLDNIESFVDSSTVGFQETELTNSVENPVESDVKEDIEDEKAEVEKLAKVDVKSIVSEENKVVESKVESTEDISIKNNTERRTLQSLYNTLIKAPNSNNSDRLLKIKELLEYNGYIISKELHLDQREVLNLHLNKKQKNVTYIIMNFKSKQYIFFKDCEQDLILKILNINNGFDNLKVTGSEKAYEK